MSDFFAPSGRLNYRVVIDNAIGNLTRLDGLGKELEAAMAEFLEERGYIVIGPDEEG